MPKSPERSEYWQKKLDRNVQRDRLNEAALQASGWDVMVIWECETNSAVHLAEQVRGFLEASSPHSP